MNPPIKLFALLIAVAYSAIASASIEIKQIEKDKVSITYNKTEANTDRYRTELDRQVRRVAEKICGSQQLKLAGSLNQLQNNKACFDEAVSNAFKEIEKSVMG